MSKKPIPTICVQPDSQTALNTRRQSSDGRFTIIDEQSKDSDSFDETSSDNDSMDQFMFSKSCYISKCSSPNLPHLNYSISQPSNMSLAASRFRVVPVEAKYQRNRWLAWDWFDLNTIDQTQLGLSGTIVRASHSSPQTPTIVSKPIFHLTPPPSKRPAQRSSSIRTAPLATPEPMSSVNFDFSDESDQENSLPSPFEKHQVTIRRTNTGSSNGTQQASNITDLREELENPQRPSPTPSLILPIMTTNAGQISPSELLNQYGLERSLSATSSTPRTTTITSQMRTNTLSPDRAVHPHDISTGVVSTVTSTHPPHSATNIQAHAHGSSIVAIDSKIEQAMDLVKTHLMFAVREEVEHLRSRIMELETTVVHLEAENSMLKEHVPNEILQSLSIQSSSNHGATAMT